MNIWTIVNPFDIFVVVVLGLCVFACYRRGLIGSLFRIFSSVIALFVSRQIYPAISKFLRETGGLYEIISQTISNAMGLDNLIQEQTLKAQTQLIGSLPLPGFLTDLLVTNNNPELYQILNVSSIEEYISGYIANICFNVVTMALVTLLVYICLKILSNHLGIVSKMPIIGPVNRIGGVLAGMIQGTLIIWLGFILFSVFSFARDGYLLELLDASKAGSWFYRHNMIWDMISHIKP